MLSSVEKKESNYNEFKDKKVHLELLRIIAIVLVFLNHSDLYYTFYTNTENIITFMSSLLISSVCRANVPLFMVITGAVLISKAESWREILKKRVSKIIIIILVASACMYILKCFVWQQNTFSVRDFFVRLITNEIHVSYWYLYRYLEILLMLPIIGLIARNSDKEVRKYLMGIGCIGLILMPIVTKITGFNLPIRFFVIDDTIFYVLLGFYLENNIPKKVYKKISSLHIVIGITISVFITVVMVVLEKYYTGKYLENTLNIMVPVIVVLVYLGSKKIVESGISIRVAKRISFLGRYVFGMYLIEYLGQKIFIKLYLWMCDRIFGVIACSVYVICILISTFLIVFGLKKIKFIGKYI